MEVLNFYPVGISRCIKGEKISCCSFSHGKNMRSLISLIIQPSICRNLLGTKYLYDLSPCGILTRFCNGASKLLGWPKPWYNCISSISSGIPLKSYDLVTSAALVKSCRNGQKGEKGSVPCYYLIQALPWGRALCRHSFHGLSASVKKVSRHFLCLFLFYFLHFTKWSYK